MVVVIDGAHLAFRSYHTFSQFTNSKNYPTGMIFGFFSILSSYADQYGGNLIIAWEGGNNWRKEYYPEYKQHREELDESVKKSFEDVKKMCNLIGLLQIKKPGYEADDAIAFITRKLGRDVRIISGDKDLIQLIDSSKKIFLLRPSRDKGLIKYDENACLEEFGIPYNRMIEYLSIVGDKSDNIVGLKGYGKVKTAKLINSLDDAITWVEETFPAQSQRVILNSILIDLNHPETMIKEINESDLILEEPDLLALNSLLHFYEIRNLNAKDLISMLSIRNQQLELKNKLLHNEPTRFNPE